MGDCMSATGVEKYDDYDWVELPEDVKAAFAALGYDQKMWDADEEPESYEKDWEELTSDEKKAAAKLGYDEEKWDEDD